MSDARPRLRAGLIAASALAALLVLVLAGLGAWQVQRLQWKTDLIARVEAQLQAPAIPAPMDWSSPAALEEYRPVTLSGRYRPEAEALVKAVTQEGGGFWVMTPLTGDQGGTVWINRGFVPQDRAGHPADWRAPEGRVSVTGLLRASQPGGGFLRKNDPAGDRWFSRDTLALAQARGLGPVAPYFIDAERGNGRAAHRRADGRILSQFAPVLCADMVRHGGRAGRGQHHSAGSGMAENSAAIRSVIQPRNASIGLRPDFACGQASQ